MDASWPLQSSSLPFGCTYFCSRTARSIDFQENKKRRANTTTHQPAQPYGAVAAPRRRPPARRPRRRRRRVLRRAGLRLLLPRAAVARRLLRHEAELLLPQVRQAGGGLRHPRALAQPRRRVLPAELQPGRRVRSIQGERPAEQPSRQVADAGVPEQRRRPLLGPRVGEARHLRRRRLRRARLLPGGAAPARSPRRAPRAPGCRRQPRRRVLYAGPDQGRHPPGDGLRALRGVQPRRVREQPALPALLLRQRRRRQPRRVPRPPPGQGVRQQDRVPGLLVILMVGLYFSSLPNNIEQDVASLVLIPSDRAH